MKLSGWKSYLVMIIGILANGAVAMGYIPEAYLVTINSILGFLGLGALKSAIKKAEPK